MLSVLDSLSGYCLSSLISVITYLCGVCFHCANCHICGSAVKLCGSAIYGSFSFIECITVILHHNYATPHRSMDIRGAQHLTQPVKLGLLCQV